MNTPKKRRTSTLTFELEPGSEKKDMDFIMDGLAAEIFEFTQLKTRRSHYYRPVKYSQQSLLIDIGK